VDANHPTPLYAQLEQSIRFAIATGKLRIGDQLPTVRQLAVDLRVNANTVAKVYAELERAGVLETRRGVGTFVSARPNEAAGRRARAGNAYGTRGVDHALDLESGRRDCRRAVGIAVGAIAENCAAMGARRDPSPGQVHRVARAGSVLDYSLCRSGLGVDRSAR